MGYFAAQKLKIPSILATPFPMTPTREFPSVLFYDGPRFGGAYNRLTHQIFEQIMWSASRSPIEQFWKKEFGQKPDGFGSPFGHQTRKELPTVVSCSNYVFARPHDWPEGVYNTGYWFLNEEPDWRPPSELTSFLENGTPPVYVGFGSLGNEAQAEKTTCMVIEALRLAGQRGVLATGWNGLAKIDDLPQEIFVLESIPHSWLFPRMAAVVHHGGAGTTAAGLQAGIPSIVIPHANDQFAWGRRVYELGVGPKPVPRKKLTAENLADAIRVALTDEIKTKARELGTNIQGENGAEAAAKIIIECIETNQPMAAKLA
jgi:sterol 3beta-glucosyltransferase